jgi:hypothetical protein
MVPQGGAKAAALKKALEKIKLPHGFHIGLYAIVPHARHLAVGPQGIVTCVGTRKAQVYALTDRSKSVVAEETARYSSLVRVLSLSGCAAEKSALQSRPFKSFRLIVPPLFVSSLSNKSEAAFFASAISTVSQ